MPSQKQLEDQIRQKELKLEKHLEKQREASKLVRADKKAVKALKNTLRCITDNTRRGTVQDVEGCAMKGAKK